MIAFRILTLIAVTAAAPAALAQSSTGTAGDTAPAAATQDAPATTGDEASDAMADAVQSVVTAPVEEVQGTTYITGQSPGSLFSSDLVGLAVYDSGGEKIGDINDLLIAGDGQVEAVVIGVGGFLGIGEKDVAVPISTLDMAFEDGDVTLSIDASEEELLEAPLFVRADGTSSDRLGAFERSFEQAREDAEAALLTAGQRAGEIYDEASREAQETASELLERGREAVRQLRGEDEAAPASPGNSQ